MPAKIDCPDIDNLVSRYTAGISAEKLAKEFGVTRYVISRWLREANVHVRTLADLKRSLDIESLAARYASGISMKQLAAEAGVSRGLLTSRFESRGIAIRGITDIRLSLDVPELIRRYESGESVKQIAMSIGVSRRAVADRLAGAGAALRGQSGAQRAKWDRLRATGQYDSAVKATCKAAWNASRGRKRSVAERIKYAKTMANRLRGHVGKFELEVAAALEAALGLGNVSWQHAVGPYNVDLAVPKLRIAMEIMRGSPGAGWGRWYERLEYIRNSGWSVVIVYAIPKHRISKGRRIAGSRYDSFDVSAVANKFIALSKRLGRDKAERGGYTVIGGDGKRATMPCPKSYQRPAIRHS